MTLPVVAEPERFAADVGTGEQASARDMAPKALTEADALRRQPRPARCSLLARKAGSFVKIEQNSPNSPPLRLFWRAS